MLLVAYFEGLDSERAIAWRAADSLSLRQILYVSLDAAPPDHSTVSRTRRRVDVETHLVVFTWGLQRLADAGLVRGETVGIDATTLEANAALRSILRRGTGADYETFLRHRAAAPRAPARTRPHPQASAPAGLRLESRTAHAADSVRRHAAWSPRPCQRIGRRAAARVAPLLGPPVAPGGAHVGKSDRSIVDSPDDAASFTHSARAPRRQFCHSLLGGAGRLTDSAGMTHRRQSCPTCSTTPRRRARKRPSIRFSNLLPSGRMTL
ncbi:MAG: transposase [Acidobacteria bacterium]|nr:transposase [Acidobacteriota bacterium]